MASTYYDTKEPYELYDSDTSIASTNSTIINLKEDLNESTQLLKNNIKKVTDRDQFINSIEEKTNMLINNSQNFKTKSNKLRRKSCIQSYFCEIILVGIAISIIISLIIVITKEN